MHAALTPRNFFLGGKMAELKLERNRMLASMMHVAHGELSQYIEPCLDVARRDPELFAHFLAWNEAKSQVKDTKVAFPCIALVTTIDEEYLFNAARAITLRDMRSVGKSIAFVRNLRKQGYQDGGNVQTLHDAIQWYLADMEKNKGRWFRAFVSDRKSLKSLYYWGRFTQPKWVSECFAKHYPQNSLPDIVSRLHLMSPQEAAGQILVHDIPFHILSGAVNMKNEDILLAILETITGNQLVAWTEMLKRYGVMDNPILKLSYEKALERAAKDRRVAVKRIDDLAEKHTSGDIQAKVRKARKEAADAKGKIAPCTKVAILADVSGSMHGVISLSQEMAAMIAERASGVSLTFFDDSARGFDVTGKTLEEIRHITRSVNANGQTSIGAGLRKAMADQPDTGLVVVITDGGENCSPYFTDVWNKLPNKPELAVVWYGNSHRNWIPQLIAFQEFNGNNDTYGMAEVVNLLKADPFELLDEVLATPLLIFGEGE
jgi:hypothetical protein